MQFINLRRNLRRVLTIRRLHDRRIAPYTFGSLKWIKNIKRNYLAWPKEDRRQGSRRRTLERRGCDRRHLFSEHLQSLQKNSRILLSREELQMIEALYKCDQD